MPEHTGEGECREAKAVAAWADREHERGMGRAQPSLERLNRSPRFHPPGLVFPNALCAHDWHELDGQGRQWDHDGEVLCRDHPEMWSEWQRWKAAADRLPGVDWARIVNPDQERMLRYEVSCAIGERGSFGWTDDVDVAIWWAQRAEGPGLSVYDHQEQEHVPGGEMPPDEVYLRAEIEGFIAKLTVPGWHLYPYLGGDAKMDLMRAEFARAWMAEHPDWEPAPDYLVAPLRAALYRAKGLERKAYEEDPPGKLSNYQDGRDLEPGYERKLEILDLSLKVK